MRNLSHKLYSRVSNIVLAFVVAVSGLTAVGPFLLAQQASAIAGVTYTDIGLTGWSKDRTTPSGGFGVESFDGRQVLALDVDAPPSAPSSFYQFEGLKKTIPASSTLKADLYIDSSWPSNVRAGIWGEGYDSSNAISSYPILEYNTGVSDNWRIFDSAGAGGWRSVSVSSAHSGWNTIELAINKADSTLTDIYVNGVKVGASVGDPTESLKTIFLNNYNFGSDDYTVRWSNIQRGVYNPDAPTNLRFIKNGTVTTLASGSYVNYTGITLYWDIVPNAERYQIQVTDPSGNVQANRYTGWYTFALDDTTRYGFFGSQQGEWKYQVRTKDATTGLWSDYTAPVTMNFDNERAQISINNPATEGGTIFVTDKLSVTATDNVELNRVTLNIYSGPNGTGTLLKSTAPFVSGKSYTLEVPITGLAEGTYSFKTNATDKAGNPLSTTLIRNFVVDNGVAPVATFEFPGIGSGYKSFTVQFSEPVNAADAENPANYFLNNWEGAGGSGDLTGDATVTYDPATRKATVTFTDDEWYLSAEQQWGVQNIRDLAGNLISPNPTTAYTSPLVAPTDPGTPTATSATNDAEIDWNWTVSTDPGGVEASGLKGYEYAFVAAGETPVIWTFTTANSVTTPAVTADGTYELHVRAVDWAGNRSATIVGSKVIDITAPTLTVNSYTGTDTTPTITGTTNGADDVVTVDGVVVDSLVFNGTTYTWSYTLPTQSVGTRTITIRSTDAAGNAVQQTATVTVIAAEPLNTPADTTTEPVAQTVTITPNNDQAVLGDETDTPSEASQNNVIPIDGETDQDVKAATDDKNNGTIFGLAWYWWVLIAALIIALIAWIAAAYRKRQAE